MKLFFFLLLSFHLTAQDEEQEIIPYFEFDQGETYYLLADSVNIRATPDLKGKQVAQLAIGTEVKILKRCSEITDLNGFRMRWYEVEFDKSKHGYVWGGKIAQYSFRSSKDYTTVFHVGLSRIDANEQSWHEVRTEQNHRQTGRLLIETWGNKVTPAQNMGSQGLSGVDDVIVLGASGEYCGDNGGSKILFYANRKLNEVLELDAFFDAPVFASHTVYFPQDVKGKPNKVLLEFASGEYVDDPESPDNTAKIDYETHTLTTFSWNGSELVSEGIKQLPKK